MFIETKHFGKIEFMKEDIIDFKYGLFGFEQMKKYIVIENPDKEIPFNWLQSIDEPELAFVITNPFLFNKEYEFDIDDNNMKALEMKKENISIYSIAVVPENIKDMTINLKAPIIVNNKNKKAKQIILDNDEYPLKYRLFER